MTTNSKYDINYEATFRQSGVPKHTQYGLRRYIEERAPIGGFLTAVLENNLAQSFGRADEENRTHLYEIVQWVYMVAPAPCWGSPEKVEAWLNGAEAVTLATFPEEQVDA